LETKRKRTKMSQAEIKFKEGMNLMKEGEKLLSTTLFRWKPDSEGAATNFQNAAICFKNAKAHEQAKEAYVKAGENFYKSGLLQAAGQAMGDGAAMAKQLKRYEEAASLYERSSNCFLENGAPDRAGETLAKAAETIKEVNIDKACEYYLAACDLYFTEGREQFGLEIFKTTTTLLLKAKKYQEASKLIDKEILAFKKQEKKREHLWKFYLSSVILFLATEDFSEATNRYQNYLGEDGFMNCEEGKAAGDMLKAYEDADQNAFNAVVSRQVFNFLENEITRLARGLKAQGVGDEGLL